MKRPGRKVSYWAYPAWQHEKALAEYRLDTLQKIAIGLRNNPDSARPSSWENGRLAACEKLIRSRLKDSGKKRLPA